MLKKNIKKPTGKELEVVISELSEISEKREKELAELDRIAKLLVRRDFALMETREEQERELKEMDRIAKMLVRRDFELSEIRERREKELEELERRTKELADSRRALMNILEDAEQTREVAEEERDKTLTIFENFPEGLLFFDRENKLSSVNPKARDFFGLEKEELLGKGFGELGQVSRLVPLLEILGEELAGVAREELKLRENLILEVSAIAVMRKEEKIGTLCILRNITREKIVERLKTEFVSIAAHQLRTPLSAIKWTLRMILDGDLGKVPRSQEDFLQKTYLSNERMIKLINDLLNVTRIEEGRFLYRLQKEDIIKIVEEAVRTLKGFAQRRGVRFEFAIPRTRLPKVKVDPEKLVLAIQNLVDNAVHYTKPKGLVKISIDYSPKKKEILFSCKDTGIGIPKDQQARVFSRFFRAANAIKTETQGTGLGLFIAKNIIEAHGGTIWFKSKEDEGTTFYFTLPIK